MKLTKILYLVLAVAIFGIACNKTPLQPESKAVSAQQATVLSEGFETGTKTAYTAADVTLGTGVWNLNDALIGNTTSDPKVGTASARVRNSGILTMKFDVTSGIGTVSIQHGRYGTDASSTWQLWYSTDGGVNYLQAGSTISTTVGTLSTATFTVNVTGAARLQIRKTDGTTSRVNFDAITISDYAGNNAVPSLTSIAPTSATAGAEALTLTVTGTNFINGSSILWNGAPLTTTFVSASQLTASVASTLLTTAGTATVAVSTPAPGGGVTSNFTFTINAVQVSTTKKFLFDASHAETAGNADWVIDEDNSTPQRIPTPSYTGVTSTTAESFWTGAISSWGIALAKKGHVVETLPSTGAITYGNTSNDQDLSNYDVFVVDEPNKRFTTAEKSAMLQFVQNGGGLFVVADHTISDRDNDGWDSPAIWNDMFSTNAIQTNPFGVTFSLNNISVVSSNKSTAATTILNGTEGTVSQLQYSNGATMSINTNANANAKGLIWTSTSTQGTSNIMAASSTFGAGRVFLIGDSSPIDDGTGAPSNTLYNGWGVYSHSKLMMNASLWLAKIQ